MTTIDPRTAVFGWHGRRISTGPPLIIDREHPEGRHSAGLVPPPDLMEVVDCGECGEAFARRTDLSPVEERPTVCHPCFMMLEAEGYEGVAAALLEVAAADDRVDWAEVEHTGGGCHSVGIRFHGTTEGLRIDVGDAENGPLCMDSPPTAWGASLSFCTPGDWNAPGYVEYEALGVIDSEPDPVKLLNDLHAMAVRASTSPEEMAAMDAEASAAWEVERLAYWDEHNPEVAASIRADRENT